MVRGLSLSGRVTWRTPDCHGVRTVQCGQRHGWALCWIRGFAGPRWRRHRVQLLPYAFRLAAAFASLLRVVTSGWCRLRAITPTDERETAAPTRLSVQA